ncbi:hypothetical protein WUBG_02960 [Wuchereria bancrofti]|uniref:Uncharacterized protein n=1 Tax=Wuchereria bancrofti TaxID=6293 RepID=J9BFT5_WUCBA|nr:hypothetical protein WUBG_02960 [Wuchereria bancrofti]
MFDSEKGSDEELLIKKCESADLKRPQGVFTVTGMFGASSNERNDFEADYWKDYRFLRNRRSVFVLKKSIDVLPECTLAPMDHRLMKQLIFGKLDTPISEEVVSASENEGNVQYDTWIVKDECDDMNTPLEIPPELWYFLDLASFFDP